MKKGQKMGELVVKDNALINASYNLELVEQRLMLIGITTARKSGKGITAMDPLSIHASEYAKQFNVTIDGAYKALKDASLSLFERQFSFDEKHKRNSVKRVKSRWVSQVAYIDDLAEIQFIFTPAVVSMFTRLEQHFTSYDLDQVSTLKSKYAIRLYELIIAWRSTGKTPVIDLEDFRNKLGLEPTEYQKMCNFKENVLDLAITQINQCTDIKVEYEQYKKGRTISGFSFTFKQKKKPKDVKAQRDPNTLDLFSQMTDKQRHSFAAKLSELPEMGRYSEGTESYQQFAVRIAEMLQDPKKIKELLPHLQKVGFKVA
jgi:plasmid replication initiation protein